MKRIEIGVALIRNLNERVRWLGKLDQTKKQVNFVIAKRLEKESWREAVTREVAWELEIDRKRDFLVSNMAQLNIQLDMVLPSDSEPTNIACAFYNVELYRKSVVEEVDQNENFIWLTSHDICNGKTASGIELDWLVYTLIEETDVIQYWESDVVDE